tara:strand:+ start:57 stop:1106 length:1050 start_codon:yes stop_codon:yes gene_type:complete
MKRSIITYISVFSLLLSVGVVDNLKAQSKVGTTAATFLTIGTGARGSALGHAYTSTARGADALFWNVSGSAIPNKNNLGSVMFTNFKMFADIDYNALGVAIPITKQGGVIGLSASTVQYGTMDVRTGEDPDGTGERFSASDLMIGVSYAQPLTKSFYIGGQMKWVTERIWDMRANTIAIDVGLTLITEYLNGARLAASIQNFGGKMQMDGINVRDTYEPSPEFGGNDRVFVRRELDSWNIPLQFKFGIAIPAIDTKYYRLELLAESHQTNDQNLNGDFGTEFTFMTNSTNFYIRGGYKDLFLGDYVDGHITYGAGFDMSLSKTRIGFDFAVSRQNYLADVQMIDFRVYF